MPTTTEKPPRVDPNTLAAEEKDLENQIEQAGIVTPPDGGYGWVVVVASFLVNMAVDGVIYTCGKTLIPEWAKLYGSESAASVAISLLTGAYYLCGPLASAFVNVFGIRAVAIGGSVVSTTAFLLTRYADKLWQVYLLFGVMAGVGFGCMYLPSIVVLSTYFSKKRSMATGIAVCGSGIGTTVFAMLNGPVFAYLGNDVGLYMLYLSAIAISGAVFSMFFAPLTASDAQVAKVAKIVKQYEGQGGQEATRELLEAVRQDLEELNRPGSQNDTYFAGSTPINRSRAGTMDKKEAEARRVVHVTEQHTVEHVAKKSKLVQFKESLASIWDKELLFSPSFMVLAISGTFTVLSFLVPFVFISSIMKTKNAEFSEQQLSLPLSLIGVFNIICRILCGIVSDHPKISPLQVSNFAMIVAGTSMMFVPFCSEVWHFALFCVPFSAGVACFAALRSVICVELVGVEKLSNAFGIMMVFMGIGALLGSPIAAFLRDLTGNYDLSFYLMGAVFAFSGIMTIRLPQLKAWEEGRRDRIAGTEMRIIVGGNQ